ncbi:hypothetical protein I8H84_03180 [Candidatus Saccharibacteria bacterium]|nr:hypothetical protein [Candidatus Saccharibacteria bacterium]MBH1972949.1 hypothetical protein [Candidatus Saccharibacteria bacterium]MBH1991151.1 hypothetical protein [Candidatus Saccharibacteria bacterium]
MEYQQNFTKRYDYAPLEVKVPLMDILSVSQSKSTKSALYCYVFLIGIVLLGAVSILGWSIIPLLSGQFDRLPTTVIMLVFFLFVIGIIYSELRSAREQVRLKSFAEANNFTYLDATNSTLDSYNGVMMNEGYSRTLHVGMRSNGAIRHELANCSYVTGSGKNSKTRRYGFIRIKLPRRLPHMVLDATANNTFGRFSNLPVTFRDSQKLSLEGDFDKYFTLYAPAEYKADALYVFTPDVMQLFIERIHTFDAEIIDDDLYLYSPRLFELDSPASLQALLDLVDSIYPKLYNQSSYYADSKVGERAVNDIAPQGERLKSRISYIVIAIIVFFVLILILPTLIRLVGSLGGS